MALQNSGATTESPAETVDLTVDHAILALGTVLRPDVRSLSSCCVSWHWHPSCHTIHSGHPWPILFGSMADPWPILFGSMADPVWIHGRSCLDPSHRRKLTGGSVGSNLKWRRPGFGARSRMRPSGLGLVRKVVSWLDFPGGHLYET